MAWTNPANHIWTTGEVVSASNMNTYIEANLAFLGGSQSALIATSEGTASGTYTDLATVGPSVTVVTQTTAFVIVGTGTANGNMSYAVSGASSISASDNTDFGVGTANAVQGSFMSLASGLTPGPNVFTAKYRSNSGTALFNNRTICVVPLTV